MIKSIITIATILYIVVKSHYGVIIMNTKYGVKGKKPVHRFLGKSERIENLQTVKKMTYPEKVMICRFFNRILKNRIMTHHPVFIADNSLYSPKGKYLQ